MKQKVTTWTVPAKMLIPWVPRRRGKVPGTSTHLGAKGQPSRQPSMPNIKGRPLAPKRGAREEGEDEGFFKNKFN